MSVLIETWRNDNPEATQGRRFAGTATTMGKKPATLWTYGTTRKAVRKALEDWQAAELAKADRPRVPARGQAEALADA